VRGKAEEELGPLALQDPRDRLASTHGRHHRAGRAARQARLYRATVTPY
jgi:hypothetical protein